MEQIAGNLLAVHAWFIEQCMHDELIGHSNEPLSASACMHSYLFHVSVRLVMDCQPFQDLPPNNFFSTSKTFRLH